MNMRLDSKWKAANQTHFIFENVWKWESTLEVRLWAKLFLSFSERQSSSPKSELVTNFEKLVNTAPTAIVHVANKELHEVFQNLTDLGLHNLQHLLPFYHVILVVCNYHLAVHLVSYFLRQKALYITGTHCVDWLLVFCLEP